MSNPLTFGFQTALQKLAAFPDRLSRAVELGLGDSALIVEKATKENIVKGRPEWPPLAPSTIKNRVARVGRGRRVGKMNRTAAARLGNLTPLIDTGDMLRSIHHELDKKGGDSEAAIGWGVIYGRAQEKGMKKSGPGYRINLPARPHMEPALKENLDRIRSAFLRRLRQVLP